MKVHNHFAGLLEMILPLALGLAFYRWQSSRRRSRRRTWRSFLEFIGQPEIVKCFLLLLVAAVLLVAIVFSFSRMGMISTLVSLGAMAAIVWIGRPHSPLPVALILLLLAGGIVPPFGSAWVPSSSISSSSRKMNRWSALHEAASLSGATL
jgi:hypothetical protein